MPAQEYLVIPAPDRPMRTSALRRTDAFADGVSLLMNDLGAEGWTYVRTDRMTVRNWLWGSRPVDLMVWTRGTEQAAVAEPAKPVRKKPVLERPAIPEHLVSPRRFGGAAPRPVAEKPVEQTDAA